MKKVIVIGLDGFEPKLVDHLLGQKALPNLAKLRDFGGYCRLSTTAPAQTPVAWSTFATGTNPGGHGIFDFIRRDPQTYLPDLSLSRYEQKNAFLPPKAVNRRGGTPLWEVLTQGGIPSTILRCPCCYPPDDINGRILAGMGVPDVRGGLGTSTFYSSRNNIEPLDSEQIIPVQPNAEGEFNTVLVGPRHPKSRQNLEVPITVRVKKSQHKIEIYTNGQPKVLEIHEGEWSDWLRVKFKAGVLQSVKGMVRFHLVHVDPVFELYASPINFDPCAPLFPISFPSDYGAELQEELGTYYTAGMVEDHNGLSNGRISEDAYLSQCSQVLKEREKMMVFELNRHREGLFFCLFDTPDRVQHMFWRFGESNHPANRGTQNSEFARVIGDHYQCCDAVIGKALEYVDSDTLVIALSDHGMNSFQRGVNVNTWLYEQGFLRLKNGMKPGEDCGDFFPHVDWSQTYAYALGLGGIYLNLQGREGQGIVSLEDSKRVKQAIREGLKGLPDMARSQCAVREVADRDDVYSGPYTKDAPDLLVYFEAGYRVSWSTALGGVPEMLFEDNVKKWGGDHIIDPSLVPGVLFMNKPFNGEHAQMVDLAPTILSALNVPKIDSMEGSLLLS